MVIHNGCAMSASTRQNLLSAAARCFAQNGFHATSVGQIAKAAGVSQGAMYNHFSGKEALIGALVAGVMDCARSSYARPLEGFVTDRLCELVNACISLRDYPIDAPVWVEILAETGRSQTVRQAFVEADETMRNSMAQLIRTGISAGEFVDLDADEVTLVIFAMIDGLIARRTMNPEFDSSSELPRLNQMLKRLLNARYPS